MNLTREVLTFRRRTGLQGARDFLTIPFQGLYETFFSITFKHLARIVICMKIKLPIVIFQYFYLYSIRLLLSRDLYRDVLRLI